ncbi:hypothetical protein [Pseudooceanicola sp. LIPI14-2-Ac024]|uniref:hypothetical protein n=1 Tax=Pseudooceanicola sp. LIPI14-2-Ac024 TaxID=3344875 RepID=UPI0035CF43F0
MSRALALPLTLALFAAASGARALPGMDSGTASGFAACAGRLASLIEVQTFAAPDAVPQTRQQRDMMLDLMEASMPLGTGRALELLQLEAKMAQDDLLMRARTDPDPRMARAALRRADREIAACRAMILS